VPLLRPISPPRRGTTAPESVVPRRFSLLRS
jgi:hypothetical protein